MDYVEPLPTHQYENHAAYSAAASKAVEGFGKFINPFGTGIEEKPLFSKENALRVAGNIAMRGQGDVLQSSFNSAFDAGVSVKDHLSKADVVKVENQELGEELKPSPKDQLAALATVSDIIDPKKNKEDKERFDSAIDYADDCLSNNGYMNVQDPAVPLNKELEGKFFTDVRIANGASNVMSAAATLTTGFIGGVAAGYLIDGQKENYVNNSRMDKYIQKTEEMLSSCKHYESTGVLYDKEGKVVSISHSDNQNGIMNKVDFKTENNKIVLSDKQSKIFDDMQLDASFASTQHEERKSGIKNSL